MLNKEKYAKELEDMLSDIIAVSKSGELGRCADTVNCKDCIFFGVACIKGASKWLNSECKELILTKEEKEYLSSVIKPFRKFVVYIEKIKYIDGWERITFYSLNLKSWECVTNLPPFQSGTRFEGMELNKQYRLEKLGL